MRDIPAYEFDVFSDDGILEPYLHYRAMRDLGPVVYLPAQQCLAVTRFEDAREVLLNADSFISGKGISLNDTMNSSVAMSVIISDGAQHQMLRKIEREPLSSSAVSELRTRIKASGQGVIREALTTMGALDAVRDIAQFLPLTIIMELGGLPQIGRSQMLKWAAAVFDLQGPLNERGKAALPALQELIAYVTHDIDRNTVGDGSWAARAFRLADEGKVAPEAVGALLIDFIAPSLDTTIAATGTLLMLLAQHPEQWQALKSDRAKVPAAINEALRVETPIRCFSRYVGVDATIGAVPVRAGDRVAVFYASGNRDERRWPNPDTFDISRRHTSEQLAFGTGRHICLGNHLARLEMTAILEAMLDEVETFSVGPPNCSQ